MLTAYDHPSARIAAAGGVDIILVGDSAAMTMLGHANTRDITVAELLVLSRAVRRGAPSTPIVSDLPFGSYETSDDLAVATARRFATEAGCDAVKLEGAGEMTSRVRAIVGAGIPVIGHVGLLPQSVTSPEGYRARGRDADQALAIVRDARALEDAGCAALVIEAVPAEITALVVERVGIPVIGIGAGAADGQVLVYHDLLGFTEGKAPRFVARYAEGRATLVDAVSRWAEDVRAAVYPAVQHTYPISAEALGVVRDTLNADPAIAPAS
ncbi:MAG: 3-methyl-2-oxobutanoate hydroxymethyltransferase [Gemmatimonadaceae bacterium]|nr:3-methyl-2-oxobutanoate hydroxymethyltransferase [Gemmatimonadaceae bacterium]